MSKTIAILTPSYNRAYILGKLYESLLAQTCFDFKWYIVDDGSVDNTKEVSAGFSSDKFEIKYIYKDNGGKHTAVNTGLEHIEEKLTFIVDSDDRLMPDAIETIVRDWQNYKHREEIAALSYYKCYSDNAIVGDCYGSDVPLWIPISASESIRALRATRRKYLRRIY